MVWGDLNTNFKGGTNSGWQVSTMSSQAAEILTSLGYKHVYAFKGGLQAWKDAGFPLVSTKYAKAVS